MLPLAIPALLLAACTSPVPHNDSFAANVTDIQEIPADESNGAVPLDTGPINAAAADVATDYTGRWIGVEGMYLVVSPGTAPGRYALEMQYDLDHKVTVEGRATDDGIAFDRGGKTLTLKPSDGTATGLKYLAGKTDCLTVASGEGYCRA